MKKLEKKLAKYFKMPEEKQSKEDLSLEQELIRAINRGIEDDNNKNSVSLYSLTETKITFSLLNTKWGSQKEYLESEGWEIITLRGSNFHISKSFLKKEVDNG